MINKNKIKKFLKEVFKFSIFVLAVVIGHFVILGIDLLLS
jgi:hypothetical protein